MATPLLHIVASCTDRKRLPVPEALRLGTVRAAAHGDLFKAWWHALQRHNSPTAPAAELYAGAHWTVVRDLPRVALSSGFQAELWVASAGYGLVPASAPIRAYAATFATGHPDAVAAPDEAPAEAAQAWWAKLAGEVGPEPAAPRTLAALARSSPHSRILVVASPRYLAAMEPDLLKAAEALRSPDGLLLVSGEPGPVDDELQQHWIPSVAALQGTLGGARMSLHARLARRILEEAATHGLGVSALRDRFIELARRAGPPPRYDRNPVDDNSVQQFILQQLRTNPKATHTGLLRAFRSSGQACEQGRFRRLFQQVAKER